MHRYNKYSVGLALCLSCLAGYIDAVGFIYLGGYFVSFMSGNSTRFAVVLATGDLRHALLALTIISLFVIGVIAGTLVSRFTDKKRQSLAVLLLVTFILLFAALSQAMELPSFAIILMVLAMGAENAVFQREGDVSVGLTYMTGTLVKLGQRIADALRGGNRFNWIPYVLLWVGFIVGAYSGALLFQRIGLDSLWIAAIWASMLSSLFYVAAPRISAWQEK